MPWSRANRNRQAPSASRPRVQDWFCQVRVRFLSRLNASGQAEAVWRALKEGISTGLVGEALAWKLYLSPFLWLAWKMYLSPFFRREVPCRLDRDLDGGRITSLLRVIQRFPHALIP